MDHEQIPPAPAAPPEVKVPSTKIHLISGGSAGLVSAFTLQPLDLLKTRLQQQRRTNTGLKTSITKELKKLANIRDLWRGVLPSTLRTSVGAGLYFTILSQTRTYIASLKKVSEKSSSSVLPKLSHAENLATGFVVRAAVGVITMPITIIKTRFESNLYNYNSMYEGFEGIYNEGGGPKGSFKNFFKGTAATLARDCPYAGLYVLFYESFKNDVIPSLLVPFRRSIHDNYLASVTNSLSAVLAASVATTITAPFDAIKTRLQLIVSVGRPPTIWTATKQIILEPGGVKNLFNGLSLRLGRKGLSAGISWCIYEELLKFL
uniref:Mitochondrial glycine transporter n=1 Tax=Candidozyma auris TaxID=498019 RepID=A0A0L0NN98_CANAR